MSETRTPRRDLDLVYVDLVDLPPEKADEIHVSMQRGETLEQREAMRQAFRLAVTTSRAICPDCGFKGHVARFFRCRWCGLYYCSVCSHQHFGPTDGAHAHLFDVLADVEEAVPPSPEFDEYVRRLAAYLWHEAAVDAEVDEDREP